jgi:iron(III) transport system substrate-binding protein
MTIRITALVTCLALILAACGGGSDSIDGAAAEIYDGECVEDSGQTVTIYSGRTENLIEPVLDAFACETGIDVEVRWGPSTDLALLLKEEGERSPAEVFLSRSPGPVGFLEAEGLLAPLSDEVLDEVSEEARSSEGTWVGFSGRKRVLVNNIDDVDQTDLPESVFELTDEKYKGQVALPATNGSFVDWFTVFRDLHGTEVATQWLDDMVANGARYYPNNRAIVEAAGRGEIEMGLVNHYYNYQEQAANGSDHRGENHDFADDDIGSLLIITAATMLKAADDPLAAEALIAYLLSPAVQRYFTQQTYEYPLAGGVEPDPILPPLNALQIGTVDFDSLGGGFAQTEEIIQASGILNQ